MRAFVGEVVAWRWSLVLGDGRRQRWQNDSTSDLQRRRTRLDGVVARWSGGCIATSKVKFNLTSMPVALLRPSDICCD
jgi:hypothetical protein